MIKKNCTIYRFNFEHIKNTFVLYTCKLYMRIKILYLITVLSDKYYLYFTTLSISIIKQNCCLYTIIIKEISIRIVKQRIVDTKLSIKLK